MKHLRIKLLIPFIAIIIGLVCFKSCERDTNIDNFRTK